MASNEMKEPRRSKHLQRNISDRLQKSIQLLDSSMLSPSSNLKTTRHRSTSSYNPHYVQQAPFDLSDYNIGNSSFGTSFTPSMNGNISSFIRRKPDINKEIGDTAFLKNILSESLDYVETDTSMLVEDSDPEITATTGLYECFKEAFQTNSSENQAFDLMDSYIEMCNENVNRLKLIKEKLPSGQNKFNRVNQLQCMLQHETNTWELLRILYHDRLHSGNSMELDRMLLDMDKHASIKQFVDSLFENNSVLRQKQLVVKWLEINASKEINDGKCIRFEYFTDKCITWEKTLNALKQKQITTSGFDKILDEIDPDAPIRQTKSLADLDQEDEINFLKSLFVYIRCGQFEQAERLCHHCGQYWRAATLQGWRFYHDPNYSGVQPDGNACLPEGNIFRDIWKLTCWKLTQHEGFNLYEKAIYAALCGNLRALLPVCSSWEEYLWAYYRVMIDTEVELELRSNFFSDREFEELPREYWDQSYSPESVFQEISASTVKTIQIESKEAYHVIQKYIILNDFEGLVEEMNEFCKVSSVGQFHLIRFAAHLVLFSRLVGYDVKEEICVSIIEQYVKFLIENDHIELVAIYTATLPPAEQIKWYAHFLQGITEFDTRQLCLQLGEDAGLDIALITKTVVENIRQSVNAKQPISTAVDNLNAQTSSEDSKKVNSIEWLIFDGSQRGEAIRQGNTLIREFLIQRKLDAAQQVLMKIPSDSIEIVVKQWRMQNGDAELTPADDNATREYLCIQAYLQAQNSYNDWVEHFNHSKPERPKLAPGANFSERVAFEHREKQFEADYNRWQHTLDLQTKTTTGKLYNVLLFIDGGWMVDQKKEAQVDTGRQMQMNRLRESCLPEITQMLYTILHSSGQYKECIQLADLIASEQHQLYKVFRKQDLYLFLNKMRESSLALLDTNKDPFGYSL